jgi:hypothetical protein
VEHLGTTEHKKINCKKTVDWPYLVIPKTAGQCMTLGCLDSKLKVFPIRSVQVSSSDSLSILLSGRIILTPLVICRRLRIDRWLSKEPVYQTIVLHNFRITDAPHFAFREIDTTVLLP